MSVKKKSLIIFIYLIGVIYSLEFLSLIFLKKNINLTEISIDQIRNQKSKLIENFDDRKDFYAFREEKRKIIKFPPLLNSQLKYFISPTSKGRSKNL